MIVGALRHRWILCWFIIEVNRYPTDVGSILLGRLYGGYQCEEEALDFDDQRGFESKKEGILSTRNIRSSTQVFWMFYDYFNLKAWCAKSAMDLVVQVQVIWFPFKEVSKQYGNRPGKKEGHSVENGQALQYQCICKGDLEG